MLWARGTCYAHAFAHGLVRSPEDAEDVAQRAVLCALTKLPREVRASQLFAFLRKAVRNEAANVRRSHARRDGSPVTPEFNLPASPQAPTPESIAALISGAPEHVRDCVAEYLGGAPSKRPITAELRAAAIAWLLEHM